MEYLPRNLLTVPPQPLSEVDVAFPSAVDGLVDLKIQVTLFIDEDGFVRKVRVDNPDVPQEFTQAIIDSFLPVRFKPGEVQTVAARSQLRVEIEFRATR